MSRCILVSVLFIITRRLVNVSLMIFIRKSCQQNHIPAYPIFFYHIPHVKHHHHHAYLQITICHRENKTKQVCFSFSALEPHPAATTSINQVSFHRHRHRRQRCLSNPTCSIATLSSCWTISPIVNGVSGGNHAIRPQKRRQKAIIIRETHQKWDRKCGLLRIYFSKLLRCTDLLVVAKISEVG